MSTTSLILNDYSKELELSSNMTLIELVNSHRSLRNEAIMYRKSITEIRKQANEKAYKDAFAYCKKNQSMPVEELRGLSVTELAVYLLGDSR